MCFIPYGIQLEWSRIPGGIHRACGIKKWLWPQPKVIPWNPYGMTGGFHGFHMDSTWITWGSVKTSSLTVLLKQRSPCIDGRGGLVKVTDDFDAVMCSHAV